MKAQNGFLQRDRATASRDPERISLHLRMTTVDKQAIKRAAKGNNRSVAREVECRLAKSIELDRFLSLAANDGVYAPIFERLAGLARRVEQMVGKTARDDIDTARTVQSAWVAEIERWWWDPELPAPATISAILREAKIAATDARPLSTGFEERTKQLARALKAIFEEEWTVMDVHAVNALARAAGAMDR
jgi:hypothetical protein